MVEKRRNHPDDGTIARYRMGSVIISVLLILISTLFVSVHISGEDSRIMSDPDLLVSGVSDLNRSVASPDGRLVFTPFIGDSGSSKDNILYNLSIDGVDMIQNSVLGLSFGSSCRAIGSDLSISGMTKREVDDNYSITFGEMDIYPEQYNSLKLSLNETQSPYRSFNLEVRAYNEGIALRYVIGKVNWTYPLTITGDLTHFRFLNEYKCYTEYGTEGTYTYQTISSVQSKCESPLTISIGSGRYLSITEANNTDFSRMYLNRDTSTTYGLKAQLDSSVRKTSSFVSPWRVFVYGETPGDLAQNSHIIYSLCSPSKVLDTSWIVPGKAFRDCSLTTKGSKEIIDFCVSNGLQYLHLDAGWYGSEWSQNDATKVRASNLNLTEVIRYGKQNGIGVILYVNIKALKGKTGTLFPLYEKWGIKGVKFGFVDGRTQSGIDFLHKAILKAAEHKLIINIHDNYRPTGLSRTYPNLMTVEGIRGNEHFPYSKHNTILPYTRMIAGQADYTPRYYPKDGVTTFSHQLTLPIMYFSPLTYLYWYHKPSGVEGKNGTQIWGSMPTVWNETIYTDGDPGSYSTVARRSGRDWYICYVNGPSSRSVEIDLSMLEKNLNYNATLYSDKEDGIVQVDSYLVTSSLIMNERIKAKGGLSMRIRIASSNDNRTLKSYRPHLATIENVSCDEDEPFKLEFIHLNGHVPPSMQLITDASFLSIDEINGTLYGHPTNDDVGTYSVKVWVKENGYGLGNFTMNLSVNNVNDHPRIMNHPYRRVLQGRLYSIIFRATDEDPTNDTLHWNLSTNATFLYFYPTNATLIGRAMGEPDISYWINISVSDGNGGLDYLNFTLTVDRAINTKPELINEEYHYKVQARRCSNDLQDPDLIWITSKPWRSELVQIDERR